MATTIQSEYRGLRDDLRRYFAGYGGFPKVLYSPYTHVALALTLICWGKWHSANWETIPLAVLPALLGFTLAAYALLLGFGDEKFRQFLARTGKTDVTIEGAADSTLMSVSAIFLHFVIVEMIALLLAIIGDANPIVAMGISGKLYGSIALLRAHPSALHHAFGFIGLFAFNWAILMALAAAIDIYHATSWYVDYSRATRGNANP
jgi:hypothetical protein